MPWPRRTGRARSWTRPRQGRPRARPPACGMLQSLQLFLERPGVITSTGLELARWGAGRDRGSGQPRASRFDAAIFCPSAGAAAYRRTMLDEVKTPAGYFDRDYFMYLEDFDLGWRARLRSEERRVG